jgi:hypothetical protein
MPVGRPPVTPIELRSTLLLAANLHGEWVRIHPFANGNGRIARLWVMWVAARYSLPRSYASSRDPQDFPTRVRRWPPCSGRHTPMATVLGQMLGDYLRDRADAP